METETSHIRQEVRNTLEPAFEQIVYEGEVYKKGARKPLVSVNKADDPSLDAETLISKLNDLRRGEKNLMSG